MEEAVCKKNPAQTWT